MQNIILEFVKIPMKVARISKYLAQKIKKNIGWWELPQPQTALPKINRDGGEETQIVS